MKKALNVGKQAKEIKSDHTSWHLEKVTLILYALSRCLKFASGMTAFETANAYAMASFDVSRLFTNVP